MCFRFPWADICNFWNYQQYYDVYSIVFLIFFKSIENAAHKRNREIKIFTFLFRGFVSVLCWLNIHTTYNQPGVCLRTLSFFDLQGFQCQKLLKQSYTGFCKLSEMRKSTNERSQYHVYQLDGKGIHAYHHNG